MMEPTSEAPTQKTPPTHKTEGTTRRFEKPSPGSWTLDASHCERPLPRLVDGVFESGFASGFREGLEAYGALLETIESASVNGFLYTCPRPLGAPPEPKGPPPKLVFKMLCWFHPEVRRRNRRAAEVFVTKYWREETARYREEWAPPIEARVAELSAVSLGGLDDGALARHLAACRTLVCDDTFVHHRVNCTRVVPVGDFMVHASEWTGATATEVLAALRGASPDSRAGDAQLAVLVDVLVDAFDGDRTVLEGDAEAVIAGLEEADGPLGDAAGAWLAAVGGSTTGFSPLFPTLRETPATLVASLRAASDRGVRAEEAGNAGLTALRARVPEDERGEFDDLLEEARSVYFLRDHSCNLATRSFGELRRTALEAGRRLANRGVLPAADRAFDLTHEELTAALEGEGTPPSSELESRYRWRAETRVEAAPELLGPPPGSPPPAAWLPAGAARLQRAVDAYLSAMFGEVEASSAPDPVVVKGLSASGGRRVGTARLVLEPGEFDRVREGDILVTRVTTPTFNVLLPLLAGVVTDRGGILSHPAIVSREYGIPGVVGTRVATRTIPDGATIEIDGDAGTVKVLS